MDAPLTRRKLKDMMDRIAEVERCLKKTLALKEAYNKLNDYWSDNNESQREIRLIKAVDNHAKDI